MQSRTQDHLAVVHDAAAVAQRVVPSFGLLTSRPPQRGLIWSTLLHLLVISVLPFLWQLIPPPVLRAYPLPQMSLTYEPITYDALPAVTDSGSGHEGGSAGGSGGHAGGPEPRLGTPAAPKAAQAAPAASPPKMVYEGPQEIISNSPNPTNTVQTIRRPDLPNAPRLKFAQKLQSMVVTAAPSVPTLSLPVPDPPKPEPVGAELAIVPPPVVADPVLPVRIPQRRQKIATLEPPKIKTRVDSAVPIPDVRNRTMPVLAPDEKGTGTKTALVVNAVSVPADAPKDIPDAELSGSFAVMPMRKIAAGNLVASAVGPPGIGSSGTSANGKGGAAASGNGAGGSDPNGTGSGGTPTGKGTGLGSGGSGTGSGTGTGAGNGTGTTGTGSGTGNGRGSGSGVGDSTGRGSGRGTGSGSGTGNGNGYGAGTGSGTGSGSGNAPGSGSGNGHFPGITIVGGSGGSGAARGRGGAPSRVPRPGYDMTIISGGTSGGATRDMGVFGRDETVYTVYVSMADVGGGPACPMQYALVDASAGGSGMLAPPYAKKKIAASATDEQLGGRVDPQPVFLSGTIDEEGRIQNVRALAPQDSRSAIALTAFEKWEFLPAQINGRPVATRVLIGMTVVRSREDKRGN